MSPKFRYKAKKGPQEIIEGEIDAENEDAALEKISAQGLIPVKLDSAEVGADTPKAPHAVKGTASKPAARPKEKISTFDPKRVRVPHRDFDIFTRQFAILLRANVPLLRIFSVLQTQTQDAKFQSVLSAIQEKLRKGQSLSDAIKEYSLVFPQIYVSMVESGEISGTLDIVLVRLAEFTKREAELRSKIVSAMVYPLFLMSIGVLTIFSLLTFILPRLMGVFSDLGTELPDITKAIIGASHFCQKYWLWMIGCVVGFSAFFRMRGISKEQKKILDLVALKTPLIGTLVIKSETSKFLRSLELLYENGISLYKAVEVSARTVDNRVVQVELEKLSTRLQGGATLTQSLQEVPYMSDFVTNMVSVGEESGKLGEAVRETASFYEEETEQMVKLATTLIEPFMILFIGSIIGFIVIGMLLPIFEISAAAK